jgi:hypothetical protein
MPSRPLAALEIWELSRNRTLETLDASDRALFAMGIVRRASLRGIQRACGSRSWLRRVGYRRRGGQGIGATAQNREQVRANFKLFVETKRDAAP